MNHLGKVGALVDGTLTRPNQVPKNISPLDLLTPDFPPTFSIHGKEDSIIVAEDSEILTKKLKALGVIAKLLVIPGDHGLQPEIDNLVYFKEGVAFLEDFV
jgi:acetyl esterase/lipase